MSQLTNNPTFLSIVIPVFEEEKTLEHTFSVIKPLAEQLTDNYEIVVVDDGSRDDSFQIISAWNSLDARIKGVRLSRNFGKEAALFAGLTKARGQIVITIDGDLQHPPEIIPDMVKKWRAGAAIVHGVKRERRGAGTWSQQFKSLFRPERREEGRLYQWAQFLFNWLFSRLAGFDMTGSSDFKLLDRRIVRILVNDLREYGRFYRGLSTWVGFKQEIIEFAVQPRTSGQSHWSTWALLRYAWKTITAFTALPLQVVPALGLLMLIVAILLSIQTLISKAIGHAVSGFATLEITLLFTGSLVMLGLGVIGQYLSQIYDELKRRPVFLIEDEIGFTEDQSGG